MSYRKYEPVIDAEKRKKTSESNRKWRDENPDKKYAANLSWREKTQTIIKTYKLEST